MSYHPYGPGNYQQPYFPAPGTPPPSYPYPGPAVQPYPPIPPKKKKGKALLIILPLLLMICSLTGWGCANMNISLADGGLQLTGFLAEQRLQATATYFANHYPFGTKLLLNDTLSIPSGKWKTTANCTYQGGALHVSVASSQTFYPCVSTYTPFFDSRKEYTYEVVLKQMDASAAGLIFDDESDEHYYHFFLMSGDGRYVLATHDDLRPQDAYQEIASGQLPGRLSFPLRLGVVVITDTRLELYINGSKLAQVSDDTAGAVGDLGVVVFNNQGKKGAWADFVNAQCWAHQSDL